MFVQQLERRLLLISPELDFAFGTGGITTWDHSGEVLAARQSPDGRILAVGQESPRTALVARFTADGLLDATFDGDGLLEVPTGAYVGGVSFGPDGKLVLLVGADTGTNVHRFNADGTIDDAFGANGVVAVRHTRGTAVGVQPDGRIVFAHTRLNPFVSRLNVDGSIDDTFRGGLAAAVPLAGGLALHELEIAPDGKVVYLGQGRYVGYEESIVGRLNADGTVDNTFDGDGRVHVTDDAIQFLEEDGVGYRSYTRLSELHVDAQGRPVVLSQLNTRRIDQTRIITRFATSGVRDATFGGGDGWIDLATEAIFAHAVGLAPDGKILVGLEGEDFDSRLSLRRYNPDGTFDPAFGNGGVVEYVRDTFRPHVVTFDNAGKPLVAGVTGNATYTQPNRFALARLTPASPHTVLNAEGTLAVDGTDGHDTVTLERSGDQVVLRRNGVATSYPASAVKKLAFWGYLGNDTVSVPFALDAELHGFAGNETFTLGDGDVTIDAGNGTARIVAGDGRHDVVVGNGHNSITLGDGNTTINAGSGNDTITLGDGADSIVSGSGNDSIVTGDGNDTIYAGHGDDEVAAGAGHDTIQGFPSQVPFDALPPLPELDPPRDGGEGRKLYFGEAGDDHIVGGSEDSRLSGGEGDDTIYGNEGHDSVAGGGGNDNLYPGNGNDTVNAGNGNDVVQGDTFYGTAGDDLVLGGDGDDRLFGEGGDDTLDGGAGADSLDGGTGTNVLDGLPAGLAVADGLLSFQGTPADDVISVWRDENAGNIVVWIDGSTWAFPAADVSRIELSGNGGNDVLKLNRFLPIPAILKGGAGDDELLGGRAADTLDGGLGADVMRGEGGKDELDYSSRTARLIVSLDGAPDDGEVKERDNAAPDIERVRGGSGDDRIAGGPGISLLYGNDGNDTLSGGGGGDALYGAAGHDTLDGGAGDDYAEGGIGNDALYGSGGADRLFGNDGNNEFFTGGDGAADTVRGGGGRDFADADELDDVLHVETVA